MNWLGLDGEKIRWRPVPKGEELCRQVDGVIGAVCVRRILDITRTRAQRSEDKRVSNYLKKYLAELESKLES